MQVKHLSLHFNALSSLPAGLGGAGSLVWLSLNANRLTELPAEICKLTGLQRLSLHINQVITHDYAMGVILMVNSPLVRM